MCAPDARFLQAIDSFTRHLQIYYNCEHREWMSQASFAMHSKKKNRCQIENVSAKNSPDPATPTVAAPAPMNFAAESISRVTGEVWNDRICGNSAIGVVVWAANDWLWLMTALLIGRR